jgi:hypothetical protein
MENFAMHIPKSSLQLFCNLYVQVHFEYGKKWIEFKKWVEEGNLWQLNLGGNPVDVWVRRNADLVGDSPASLQEHFNKFCQPPTGYGFKGYEIKL